jgi:sugar/nucleoside kinase (ribokinase family)
VDLLVMPLETPMETIEIAARIAKERGARVILNPAPACDLDQGLLQKIDILIPNESESERRLKYVLALTGPISSTQITWVFAGGAWYKRTMAPIFQQTYDPVVR